MIQRSGILLTVFLISCSDSAPPEAPTPLKRDPLKVCPANYQKTAPAAGWNKQFDVSGESRLLYLRLPDPSRFTGPRPLVVDFHGSGRHANAIDDQRKAWSDELLSRGVIVVGLEGYNSQTIWPVWDAQRTALTRNLPNKDVAFFDAAVDCIAAHFEVDAARVYVSGFSAGGGMCNLILQERSHLLAGGVVNSGLFDGTQPPNAKALKQMAVLVAWGGGKDIFSGSASYTSLVELNLVTQSSLSSQFYHKQAAVTHLACQGPPAGTHVWLKAANKEMANFLLSHPKSAASSDWTLEQPGGGVSCSEDAFVAKHPISVACTGGAAECRAYCQDVADCLIGNYTVGPATTTQAKKLGFTGGDYPTECAGCISACTGDLAAGGATDQDVLKCFAAAATKQVCTAGMDGALPFIDRTKCCAGKSASKLCARLCGTLASNLALTTFFPSCAPFGSWAPNTTCSATPFPLSIPDPVTISGQVRLTDVSSSLVAKIEVFRSSDDKLIDSMTTPATGQYSLSVATGGKPLAVYFRISGTGMIETYRYFGYPLTGNVTTNQKVLTVAEATAYAATGGLTLTPGKGLVQIGPRDCNLKLVRDGAVISTTPAAPALAYEKGTSCDAIDSTLTASTTCTWGTAYNLDPGKVKIEVKLDSLVFRSQTVKVAADAMTWVTLQPKRPD